MNKSLEALDKIVEKYDWLGKEYCRLIGKGDELHKVNQTAFVECLVTPIKQDLERLKQLENENQELKEEENRLCIEAGKLFYENAKLKKAIDWLKHTFEITLDSKVRISDGIDCIQAFPIDMKNNEVIYELLKEVLKDDK